MRENTDRGSCSTRNARRPAIATNTGRNVYLIRQKVEHPCGEHLVNAVVIATGPGRAVKDVLRHVRTHYPSVIARRSRLSVIRIGENAPERIEPQGTDHDDVAAVIIAVVLAKHDGL